MVVRKNNYQVFRFFKQQYGFGIMRGRLILTMCGYNLHYSLKFRRFTRKYRRRISLCLRNRNWILFNQLKQQRVQKFYFYKILQNYYKYYRLKYGLPLNGQRTRSNRQSSKKFFKNNQIFFKHSSLSVVSKESLNLKRKFRKEKSQKKRLKIKKKFIKYIRAIKKKIKL